MDEMAAMRAAMNNPAPIVPPVEPIVPPTEPIVPPIVPPVEPIIVPPVVPPVEAVKPKTWDEEFSERFENKYKSVDELKSILNTPKEELDPEVKHWQELKKAGVKIDKEFFEIQNLKLDGDAEGNIDPHYVLLEAMKRKKEWEGLPERTLKNQLNKKYNLNEWIEKDEADLTEDDIDNREIMKRDAQIDLGWLQNYKKERTFVKPVDENAVRLQAQEREDSFKQFESLVDTEVVGKILNLSTIIDAESGEKFDYKISEADGKEFGNLMKGMAKGDKNLFDQFAYNDVNGVKQINHQKIFEMLIKNKNYEQAVKNAYNDGKAVGAKNQVKDLKNSGFPTNEGHIQTDEPQTEAEARRHAYQKQG